MPSGDGNAAAARPRAPQIAIITGEVSGDRVGAQLAGAIRDLCSDARIWGSGGTFLRAAGVEVLWDTGRFGMIGVVSALRLLPRLLHVRTALRGELLRRRPDVLVTVDAGAFNVPLCRWVKRHLPDTKILYFFPPGSWRRTLTGSSLGQVTDKVATPFPWSETELRRFGVDATFVGHPLLDLVRPAEPADTFAARYGINLDRPVVGLLPGSRAQEIAHILPVQLEAAALIHRRVPGVQFLVALAPTVDRNDVVRAVENLRRRDAHLQSLLEDMAKGLRDGSPRGPAARPLPSLVTPEGAILPADNAAELARARPRAVSPGNGAVPLSLAIVEDATYDVMAASDVLITTSGTATLEAAILHKPMVIVYRMSRANVVEYQFVKKKLPPHVGMPNLLAGRRVCPEFVQDEATGPNIAGEVISLLLEPERLLRMKRELNEAVALLGEHGGAERAARMVLDLAGASPPGTSPAAG